MRDEQYYALANLIKRPMRRWWARVGLWWMVGLGVLLVAQAYNQYYVWKFYQSGGNLFHLPTWSHNLESICGIIPAIAIGVSLQCSLKAIKEIDHVVRDTLAFCDSAVRQYKYRVALLNSWPTTGSIFFYALIGNLLIREIENPQIDLLSVLDSFQIQFSYSLWVIWLVALVIVTTGTRWQMWSLFIAGLLAYHIFFLCGWSGGSPNQHFQSYTKVVEFPDFYKSVFGGIGLFLVYRLFYLNLIGKNKPANLICIGLVLIPFLVGICARLKYVMVDLLIQTGGYQLTCMQPLAFTYSHFDSTLRLFLGSFSHEFPASPAWAIVPVLNSIFWLFAHYFAFSWLLGRKVSQRVSN